MWQLYWPNWWKLWPHYHSDDGRDDLLICKVFCFGPLQFRWYSVRRRV